MAKSPWFNEICNFRMFDRYQYQSDAQSPWFINVLRMHEDTLNQFIKVLGKSNPDEFTQCEWDLIWAYTKSDGCTGCRRYILIACVEHDFLFQDSS